MTSIRANKGWWIRIFTSVHCLNIRLYIVHLGLAPTPVSEWAPCSVSCRLRLRLLIWTTSNGFSVQSLLTWTTSNGQHSTCLHLWDINKESRKIKKMTKTGSREDEAFLGVIRKILPWTFKNYFLRMMRRLRTCLQWLTKMLAGLTIGGRKCASWK